MLIEKTFEKLLEHFEKSLKIGLQSEIINWDKVKEYRERRHIIVHNSSVVNKKYLSRTKNPYNLRIGDVVKITSEYFIKSMEDFQLAGLLLIFECWGNWDKTSVDKAILRLSIHSYNFLKEGKYNLCLGVCNFCDKIEARNSDQEISLLKIKINKCIAYKKLSDKPSLKRELKKIQVGTAAPHFKVAHQILNDDDRNLFENFNAAKKLGEINMDAYLNWPLFDFVKSREDLNQELLKLLNE